MSTIIHSVKWPELLPIALGAPPSADSPDLWVAAQGYIPAMPYVWHANHPGGRAFLYTPAWVAGVRAVWVPGTPEEERQIADKWLAIGLSARRTLSACYLLGGYTPFRAAACELLFRVAQ